MPDKPLWLSRIPGAIQQLESLGDGWVDRALLESLLGIGRRRAQQILSVVGSRRVGSSLVVDREGLVNYLKQSAGGETAHHEERRQRKLWDELARTRDQWINQPPVLIEVAPDAMRRALRRDLDGLPEGVELSPGKITVEFANPEEALQKLMALAVAIGRNREAFHEGVRIAK